MLLSLCQSVPRLLDRRSSPSSFNRGQNIFRTVFPIKQDAIHAEEGENVFSPGKWGRNPEKVTLSLCLSGLPSALGLSLRLTCSIKKLFLNQCCRNCLFPLPLSGRNGTKKCYDPRS